MFYKILLKTRMFALEEHFFGAQSCKEDSQSEQRGLIQLSANSANPPKTLCLNPILFPALLVHST